MTDLIATITGLLACALIAAFAFFKHFKKHDGFKAPIIPWIIPSLAALATGFMLLVHLVNILGIETGRR